MNSPLILSYNDYSRANAEKKEKVKYGGSNLKVYIFLADGFEEIEGLTVVDIMRRAKIDVETISITGQKQINGAHKIIVEADRLFEETDFSDGDMLVLPGGMPGTLNLKEHEGLRNLIGEFDKKKKYLAAICAAPSILSELGILKGRKACAYPSFEEGLDCAQVVHEAAVTDMHRQSAKIFFPCVSCMSELGRKNTGNMRMCMLYYDNDCECIFFYKCDMTKRQF